MVAQSEGLTQEIDALRKVDRVFSDESIPLSTRRRVFVRMLEAYGPVMQPAENGQEPAAGSGG